MHETTIFYSPVELSDSGLAPEIDVLAAGTFLDKNLQTVTITNEDLAEIVANTQLVLSSTADKNGNVVGLPIDAQRHDNGDGAGWMISLRLADDGRIKARPSWTKIGRELIGEGIRRFFSATVDLRRKIVKGGTLTNWPATRGKRGEVLLAPIELESPNLMVMRDVSRDDGNQLRSLYERLGVGVDDMPEYILEGGNHMPKKNDKDGTVISPLILSDEDRALLVKNLVAELSPLFELSAGGNDDDADDGNDGAAIVNLSDVRERMMAKQKAAIQAEYARLQQGQEAMLSDLMQQMRHDQEIAEFSDAVTNGKGGEGGLPIPRAELTAFLGKLGPGLYKEAKDIFDRIVENGLVQFEADGHGKRVKGVTKLDERIAVQLREHVSEGGTIDAFFSVAQLGDPAEYDLAEFEGGK